MNPGKELDALIAEKVMGQTKEVRERWRGGCLCGREETCAVCHWPLPYSTDLTEAWEVVQKMRALGRMVEIRDINYLSNGVINYWVCFSGVPHANPMTALTAPHAICLAALNVAEAMEGV